MCCREHSALELEPFENVRDQIGYCGIWCGSCAVGNGALRELTRRYGEIVESYGLEGWAPEDFDYGEFSRMLSSIHALPPCRGCLEGDGSPGCPMRACAVGRGLSGCNGCDPSGGCENAERLRRMREGALEAGLMVETGEADRSALMEEWKAELRSRWPSSILFEGDR